MILRVFINRNSRVLFLIFCIIHVTFHINAQFNDNIPTFRDKLTLGVGAGYDYGGLGGNFLFYPFNGIGLFVGAGHTFADFGYSAGIKIRFIQKKQSSKINLYTFCMYGYNACILALNASQYNKIFYGYSVGIGFDYRTSLTKMNYWSIDFLIPFRNPDAYDYYDDLSNNPNVNLMGYFFPVGFSFGYRFFLTGQMNVSRND